MYTKLIQKLRGNPEFLKLKEVGGHAVYHLEGDALVHTLLVAKAAAERYGSGSFMELVAMLHDIGKIRHHQILPDGSFQYPHHADGGAEELKNFIPTDFEEFRHIQWLILNHIKPLFFPHTLSREEAKVKLSPPHEEWFDELMGLVICDLKGSQPLKPQTDKITFLERLLREGEEEEK